MMEELFLLIRFTFLINMKKMFINKSKITQKYRWKYKIKKNNNKEKHTNNAIDKICFVIKDIYKVQKAGIFKIWEKGFTKFKNQE